MKEILLQQLKATQGPVGDDLVKAFVTEGTESLPALIDILRDGEILSSPSPEGWIAINAVRILGDMGSEEAIAPLIDVLRQAQEHDRMGEQVVLSLERLGPPVVAPLVSCFFYLDNPWAREMALEILTHIAQEYRIAETDKIYKLLAKLFEESTHPADRILYAGYLSDLGKPEAIEVILETMRRERISCDQYEAFLEAIERLGGECPPYYFDEDGKGYPLDEDKIPVCPVCRGKMGFLENGDLVHRDDPHLIHQEEES
jgi:hypothetical protein